jgi:hypothetical protein
MTSPRLRKRLVFAHFSVLALCYESPREIHGANILIDSDRSQGDSERSLKYAQTATGELMIDLVQHLYQMYSRGVKIARLGLQPELPLKAIPSGAEFAQFLVNEAGLDSARLRSSVEDACLRDLKVYFESRKIEASRDWLLTLARAELAGGAFAANNLPERLRRYLDEAPVELVADIAADISILLQDKRSDFNYFRYSLNAVSTVMGDLFREDLFDDEGLNRGDLKSLQDQLANIFSKKLSDEKAVANWLDDIMSFHFKLIAQTNTPEVTSARDAYVKGLGTLNKDVQKSKSFVSTKSMSTYKLRVYDYAMLQSRKFIKSFHESFQQTEFELRSARFKSINSPTQDQIAKILGENKNRKDQATKYLSLMNKKESNNNSDVVSVVEYLSKKRELIVSYAGEGVAQRLIKPILNSLKSQLQISPSQQTWKSEAKSGSDFLSVQIDDLRSEDLAKIEKILQLHAN